jgi:hypothetical protein
MAAKANATAAPPTASIGPRVTIAAPAVDVEVEVATGLNVPLEPLAKYFTPLAALVALAIRDAALEALSVTTAWP